MTVQEILEILGDVANNHEITDVKHGKMITCFKLGVAGNPKKRQVAVAVWIREEDE